MKKILKIIILTVLLLIVLGLAGVYAVYNGIILLNNPSKSRYPVRGVDVSHYQGTIEWPVLAEQGIDFAYIKATEGSSHTDSKFEENWQGAKQTDLRIGAYHFFSFDSPAESQLAHYTGVVSGFEGMLPPVVDFEFYGDKKVNPPDVETVTEQLAIMLDGLESHYETTPVIYATEDTYELYLKGRFDKYPLWIRDVIKRPGTLSDWTFWQYTNREKLDGYSGEEIYIDMNVFYGDRSEWEAWPESRKRIP